MLGLDNIDYGRYPDQALQYRWLRHYLNSWHTCKGLPEPTLSDVQKLYVAVNKCAPVSYWQTLHFV